MGAGRTLSVHRAAQRVPARAAAVTKPDRKLCPELVKRLKAAFGDKDLAVAKTGDQPYPVFCAGQDRCVGEPGGVLGRGGRIIDTWYASLQVVEVSFDDEPDAFRNINTVEELNKS